MLYVDTSRGFPRGLYRADDTGRTLLSGDLDAVTPAWSPSSEQVAFAGEHGTADAGLYVATDDGAPERIVDQSALYPAWSPDGTEIAFTGDRQHVHVVAADGAGLRRVSRRADRRRRLSPLVARRQHAGVHPAGRER